MALTANNSPKSTTLMDGASIERKKLFNKPCTWEELARHNKKEDCWIAVDGKVYDITSWIPKHPGGEDLLLLSAGRDCTNLFESYHLTEKPYPILNKYYIGDISDTELPKFTVKSPFYSTLRKRVLDRLKEKNIDPQSGWRVTSRIGFVYLYFACIYYLAHFATSATSIWSAVAFGILIGFGEVLFAMHILHDASHASIGHNPNGWRWFGTSFDILVGANFFSWYHQHVLGHHLYTNVRGADPDLGENDVDFRRVSPSQKWRWYYQYQHIYAPILYGLLGFKYRMQDWQVFVWRTNGQIRVSNPPSFYVFFWIFGKISFLTIRLVVPLVVMSFSRILIMFFIAEFTLGYYLAFVFQVSHIAPGLEFLETPLQPNPSTPVDEDWAIMQVRTTQDYAHQSAITNFLTGALNYQVVHHLFPTISQSWYSEIAPVVVDVCKEFEVEYIVLPSFVSAFQSHLQHLRDMGKKPADVQKEEDEQKALQKQKKKV